jgi:MFS family permease
MVQAFVLTGLVLTGLIEVWHIIALGLLLGVVTAFDGPARQSFVVQMVDQREDLGNAIALNSSAFNIARLIGPSVAGALLALTGEWLCFLLNAVSFLAVIVALLMMKVPRLTASGPPKDVLRSLKEGIAYTYANAPIRTVLVTLAIVSLTGMQYGTLMPVFARDILHGGPQAFGLLMTSTGCGALVGALYLASRRGTITLGRQIPLAIGLFGTSLVMFSFSRHLWLSLVLVLATGFGQIVHTASSNTVVQTMVDEDKRGRVMSLYMMAFMGTAPFGNLLAGSLASAVGTPNTLLLGGGASLLAALYFAWRLPSVRKAARSVHAEIETAQ